MRCAAAWSREWTSRNLKPATDNGRGSRADWVVGAAVELSQDPSIRRQHALGPPFLAPWC
jgi:hypothetical protein